MPVIRSIVRDADKDNDKFMSILMGIIKSAPFQMRTKASEGRTGARADTRRPNVHHQEAHSAPHVPARRWRDDWLAAARLAWCRRKRRLNKTAAAPASASSASGTRTARRRDTGVRCRKAPTFDFSFITKPLEPFRNRVTLDHRTGHAGGHGHTPKNPAAIMRAARFCSPAPVRAETP